LPARTETEHEAVVGLEFVCDGLRTFFRRRAAPTQLDTPSECKHKTMSPYNALNRGNVVVVVVSMETGDSMSMQLATSYICRLLKERIRRCTLA
jgi:hypothetical protein